MGNTVQTRLVPCTGIYERDSEQREALLESMRRSSMRKRGSESAIEAIAERISRTPADVYKMLDDGVFCDPLTWFCSWVDGALSRKSPGDALAPVRFLVARYFGSGGGTARESVQHASEILDAASRTVHELLTGISEDSPSGCRLDDDEYAQLQTVRQELMALVIGLGETADQLRDA